MEFGKFMYVIGDFVSVLAGAGIGALITTIPKKVKSEHRIAERSDEFRSQMRKLQGLICIGFAISSVLTLSNDTTLAIIIMVVSVMLGELLDIDGKINTVIELMTKHFVPKRLVTSDLPSQVSEATLISISGALSVFASLDLVTTGNPNKMILKCFLDIIGSLILSSSGSIIAIILSAIPIFAYQTMWYVLGSFCMPFATPVVADMIGGIGGVVLINIALQLLGIDTKLKSSNYILSFFIPFILSMLQVI